MGLYHDVKRIGNKAGLSLVLCRSGIRSYDQEGVGLAHPLRRRVLGHDNRARLNWVMRGWMGWAMLRVG